jgi:hypothetical protein
VSSSEVLGFCLRRPVAQPSPPLEMAKRIKEYLARCKPQIVAIALRSGGWNFFSVEGERFRTGRAMSYLGIGKCLFARFKMLPATVVLTRVYYASSTVAMIRSGHFFPLGFSPSRRRAVSVDDLIFYLVTRSV